jgi:hypothetical protein
MIEIEKDYFVTDDGKVFSKRKFNKLTELKLSKTGHKGYVKVVISNKAYFVHRLVAKAYLINLFDKKVVNHINGIKHDNRVQNLEWCTRSENSKHAYDIGLHKPYTGLKDKGNNKFYKEWNNLIKQGISMRKIAKQYGVSHRTIGNVVKKYNNLKIN